MVARCNSFLLRRPIYVPSEMVLPESSEVAVEYGVLGSAW